MKKNILLLALFSIGTLSLSAQCDEILLENAKKGLDKDEVLIKEYKVKLDASTINQPAPVAEFSQKFDEGEKYRLRIVSDKKELKSEGILRLFEGNIFLGTSYSEEQNKHFESFDFKCQKSGNYKILATFQDGKAGCAVVLVTKLK